jgi:hypothetical protein
MTGLADRRVQLQQFHEGEPFLQWVSRIRSPWLE